MINTRISILLIVFGLSFISGRSLAQIAVSSSNGCVPHVASLSLPSGYSSYSWSISNGDSSSLANPTILFNNAGTYHVSVTAVNASNNSESFVLTNAIVVSETPSPSFSVDNDTVCLGDSVSMEVIQGNNNSTYNWSFGDGGSDSNLQANHLYSQSGNYGISLQETNAAGCAGFSSTQSVHVRAVPNASFTLSNTVLCDSLDSITATAVSTSGTSWELDEVPLSTSKTVSITALSSGSHDLKLTVGDGVGCESSSSQQIWVNAPIEYQAGASVSSGCAPLQSNLVMDVSTSGSTVWHTATGDFQGDSVSAEFTTTGNHVVWFEFTDSVGCNMADTLDTIVVNASLPMNYTRSDSVLCDTGTVQFSLLDSNVSSVQWSLSGVVDTGQTVDISCSGVGSHALIIDAQHTNGCSKSIVVQNALRIESGKPETTLSPLSACGPYTVETEHANPYLDSALWIIENDTATGETASFSISTQGAYDLIFIGESEHGCRDTSVITDFATLSQAEFEWPEPSMVNSCGSADVIFDASQLGSNSFLWQFGDGTSSTDSVVTHAFDSAGTYIVSLQMQNESGCGIEIESHSVVQIDQPQVGYDFNVLDCQQGLVEFYSTSSGAETLTWQIGDSTYHDSSFTTQLHPAFPWSVSLSASTSQGCSSTMTDINAIVLDSCLPVFSGNLPFPSSSQPSDWYTSQAYPLMGCSNETFTFNHPQDSVVSVIFDFGDGDTNHTAGSVTHSYDSAGRFDLTIVSVLISGDTDSLVIPEYVHIGKPKSDFTLLESNGCFGSQVVIDNLSQHAQYWTTYFGDGFESNLFEAQHTYDTNANFTVRLRASDTLECESNAFSLMSAGTPYPAIDVPSSVCAQDTFTLPHNVYGYHSYMWLIDDSTVLGREPQFVFENSGTYTFSMLAIDSNECSTTFFDSTSIVVLRPEVSFDLGSTNHFCNELNTALVSQTTGVDGVKWYFDGAFVSIDSVFQIELGDSGSFPIKLKGQQANCISEFIDTIHISQPIADFAMEVNTLCLPSAVSFSDSSTSAVNWNWSFGDGQTEATQNVSHTYTDQPTDSIKLEIIDQWGCASSKAVISPDFNVVNIVLDQTTYCYPAQPEIRDLVGNGVQYEWVFEDTTIIAGDSIQPTLSDSGVLSFSVNIAHTSGCTSHVSLDSVAIITAPKAAFELSSLSTGCAPQNAKFQNSSEGVQLSYLWSFGDGGSSSIASPVYTYDSPGDYQVELTATDVYGCSSTHSSDDSIQIQGPIATFNLSASNTCEFDSVNFINTSNWATGYLWLFGDGATDHIESPAHSYNQHGAYESVLIAYDNNGCTDVSIPHPLTVNPVPDLDFNLEQLGKCVPAQFKLKDFSTQAGYQTFKLWFDEQIVEVESGSLFDVSAPGTYHPVVTISTVEGCGIDTILADSFVVYDTIAESEVLLSRLSVTQDQVEVGFNVDPSSNYKSSKVYVKSTQGYEHLWQSDDTQFEGAKQIEGQDDGNNCFKIQPLHHCVNTLSIQQLPEYCTIGVEVEGNEQQREVSWNEIGNVAVSGYDVLVKSGDQTTYTVIGSVESGNTSFEDGRDACPGKLTYVVRANDINGFGPSMGFEDLIRVDTLPYLVTNPSVDLVTTLPEGEILVEWENLQSEQTLVEKFLLHRLSDEYVTDVIQLDPRAEQYIDDSAISDESIYTYELELVGMCGLDPRRGSTLNNLLLRSEQEGNEIKLHWNSIEGWSEQLRDYEIQIQNEYGEWEKYETVPPTEHSIKLDLRNIEFD